MNAATRPIAVAFAMTFVVSACRTTDSNPPPGASAGPSGVVEQPSSDPASSSDMRPPDPGARTPAAFSKLSKLRVQQGQGGPSIIQCNGIVFETTIDLTTNGWTHGACFGPDGGTPATNEPLTMRTGELTADERTRLEAAFAKLTVKTAPGCGHDGGTITLTLTLADGTTESYVDENWGCKKPPPVIAVGLRDFASIVGAAIYN